jgi:hypothetical protein
MNIEPTDEDVLDLSGGRQLLLFVRSLNAFFLRNLASRVQPLERHKFHRAHRHHIRRQLAMAALSIIMEALQLPFMLPVELVHHLLCCLDNFKTSRRI